VAGRAFAFADPEVLHLAKTAFLPACADDWYQRRRTDAEGRFWKRITAQSPRSADAPTHQGIYVLTADGELLAFKNAGQSAAATREQLAYGLRKWNDLPDARRKPGSITIPDHGPLDPIFSRTPPEGGAIVRVHTRILDRAGVGYRKGTCDTPGADRAARDFLWLTADDVKSLTSLPAIVGHEAELATPIIDRLVRFHLVDNTRGEPEFWTRADVHEQSFRMFVTKIAADGTEMRLDGEAHLDSDHFRGYEARLFGRIRIGPNRSIERFDLVAIGDHWGAGAFTKGERPGRSLLGISFELVDPAIPTNRIAPQAARNPAEYFGNR
jgi:hypothetical protein